MPAMPTTDCNYEVVRHAAQIELHLQAETAAELFVCAAQVMFQLLQPHVEIEGTDATEWQQIALSAADTESLLVEWLGELLFLYETTGCVFEGYTILIWEPTFIEATVMGARAGRRPALHIRAVTYHELEVGETLTGWQARVLFDI